VGNFAFQDNQISRLIIGSRVPQLGEHAFTFNKLESVLIPESVQFYMKTAKKEQTFDFEVKIERGDTSGLRL
jgi:hypothetical protein